MFKPQQLRYLVSVAAEGSIRAAARELELSQATLTQGLRELEGRAQVGLLERLRGGVRLTAAGEDLLRHARRVLAQMDEAERAMAMHREGMSPQRLSLGITPWVGETLLPRLLPAFRAELPHVQLELIEGLSALTLPRLREGSLDLVVGRLSDERSMHGLQARPLFHYELTVAARVGHPRASATSVADLVDDDWAVNFAPQEVDHFLHNLFGQHGVQASRQRMHLVQSATLMMALVRQTDMLTLCPWPLLEIDRLRRSLVALPLRERFRTHTVGIIRRAHEAPSHAAARFIAHLLDQVRAWPATRDAELRRILRLVDLAGDAGPPSA